MIAGPKPEREKVMWVIKPQHFPSSLSPKEYMKSISLGVDDGFCPKSGRNRKRCVIEKTKKEEEEKKKKKKEKKKRKKNKKKKKKKNWKKKKEKKKQKKKRETNRQRQRDKV